MAEGNVENLWFNDWKRPSIWRQADAKMGAQLSAAAASSSTATDKMTPAIQGRVIGFLFFGDIAVINVSLSSKT